MKRKTIKKKRKPEITRKFPNSVVEIIKKRIMQVSQTLKRPLNYADCQRIAASVSSLTDIDVTVSSVYAHVRKLGLMKKRDYSKTHNLVSVFLGPMRPFIENLLEMNRYNSITLKELAESVGKELLKHGIQRRPSSVYSELQKANKNLQSQGQGWDDATIKRKSNPARATQQISNEKITQILSLSATHNKSQIARIVGVKRETVARVLNRPQPTRQPTTLRQGAPPAFEKKTWYRRVLKEIKASNSLSLTIRLTDLFKKEWNNYASIIAGNIAENLTKEEVASLRNEVTVNPNYLITTDDLRKGIVMLFNTNPNNPSVKYFETQGNRIVVTKYGLKALTKIIPTLISTEERIAWGKKTIRGKNVRK